MKVFNSVISEENSNICSMNTNELFDLLTYDGMKTLETKKSNNETKVDEIELNSTFNSAKAKGLQSILQTLGELWDENEYNEEYNLQTYLEKIEK